MERKRYDKRDVVAARKRDVERDMKRDMKKRYEKEMWDKRDVVAAANTAAAETGAGRGM